MRTTAEIAADMRTQLNDLIDVLESDGFCTSRDCMCDHSKPIVKLNAAITELEQGVEPHMQKRMGL